MSCNYADGLSPYENKGKLGLAEKFDSKDEVVEKVKTLTQWIQGAKHVVVHTGAGISTTAGIPDFRGPNGVWTLEAKGEKPDINISFNDAIPTKTHMSLVKLLAEGKIHYVVSQNIDGLHLRSGLPRSSLAELHGNMFVEQCAKCSRQFVRCSATSSVGQKCLQKPCPTSMLNSRPCRGRMHDVILDWEHDLPERDLGMADFHSCVADLSICLGTTLQIIPSGNLPLHTKKYGQGGKLVICNLQPTKHDKKADLLIHAYVDEIMSLLMENLGLAIPEYTRDKDPTYHRGLLEWTIPSFEVQRMRRMYEVTCCKMKRTKVKSDLEDYKNVKKVKFEKVTNIKTENIKEEIKEEKVLSIKEEPAETSRGCESPEIEQGTCIDRNVQKGESTGVNTSDVLNKTTKNGRECNKSPSDENDDLSISKNYGEKTKNDFPEKADHVEESDVADDNDSIESQKSNCSNDNPKELSSSLRNLNKSNVLAT
ncbi:NAD-dependent protein deacetylase Sirt6 [Nilaparvata lugens]|uniref:NAD-dependent protein deacetylase Sirt6 n=1 Tax=Nilaparvata lugens TaxID=108931 RepID=UPI00193CE2B8|nr:NAD-dependent protein deacetylase Sirt6 [Nilaparvata lugens]